MRCLICYIRIKLLSKLKINVSDEPQDGRFSIALPEKNIETFSHGLTNKRMNVARGRLNSNTDSAIFSSFYKSGPAIFFMRNGSLRIVETNEAILEIARRIGRKLSLRGLYGAILRSETISFGSMLAMLKIISKNSLWGRGVEIL